MSSVERRRADYRPVLLLLSWCLGFLIVTLQIDPPYTVAWLTPSTGPYVVGFFSVAWAVGVLVCVEWLVRVAILARGCVIEVAGTELVLRLLGRSVRIVQGSISDVHVRSIGAHVVEVPGIPALQIETYRRRAINVPHLYRGSVESLVIEIGCWNDHVGSQ